MNPIVMIGIGIAVLYLINPNIFDDLLGGGGTGTGMPGTGTGTGTGAPMMSNPQMMLPGGGTGANASPNTPTGGTSTSANSNLNQAAEAQRQQQAALAQQQQQQQAAEAQRQQQAAAAALLLQQQAAQAGVSVDKLKEAQAAAAAAQQGQTTGEMTPAYVQDATINAAQGSAIAMGVARLLNLQYTADEWNWFASQPNANGGTVSRPGLVLPSDGSYGSLKKIGIDEYMRRVKAAESGEGLSGVPASNGFTPAQGFGSASTPGFGGGFGSSGWTN